MGRSLGGDAGKDRSQPSQAPWQQEDCRVDYVSKYCRFHRATERAFYLHKNSLFMNDLLTLDDFEKLGLWNRIDLAVARDKNVKAALAITGADPKDIAQDAITCLLENFAAVVARCHSKKNPLK
jgi:hypothetical protein